MRLYFHPLSSNSRRVTMTARQLGLELDLVIVDLLKGEHKDPEFLRFNPNQARSHSSQSLMTLRSSR